MSLLVIGDVHGNYYALEAIINEALKVFHPETDAIVFTGDYVGDFPDGSKVVDLIQKLSERYKVYAIKGNRETGQVRPYLEAKRNGTEPNWNLDTTMGSALVCCRELRDDQLEYLDNLPDTLIIREEGTPPLFVKHKMPLTAEELELVRREHMAVVTAHTHEYHTEIKDGIRIFNSGSCGLTDHGLVGTCYGYLNYDQKDGWYMIGVELDYEYEKTIESLKENKDLYERCQGWGKALELSVQTGINCTALYSFEANRLAVLAEEAQEQGIEPNLEPTDDLQTVFSQGRYANVNYDGSRLVDVLDFGHIDDVRDHKYVELPVLTSEGTSYKRAKNISPEIYEKALENITQIALKATHDDVVIGRHEARKK